MKDKIKNIMASVLEVPESQLKEDTTQNQVANWDSLRHLNLVIELEETFNVSYEPEEIAEMNSLEKITALTKAKSQKIA
jgi:acyl carrier protein